MSPSSQNEIYLGSAPLNAEQLQQPEVPEDSLGISFRGLVSACASRIRHGSPNSPELQGKIDHWRDSATNDGRTVINHETGEREKIKISPYGENSEHMPLTRRERKIADEIFSARDHRMTETAKAHQFSTGVYNIGKSEDGTLRANHPAIGQHRATTRSARRQEKFARRTDKAIHHAEKTIKTAGARKHPEVKRTNIAQSPRVVRNNSYHQQRRRVLLNYADRGLLDFPDALDIGGAPGLLDKSKAKLRNLAATRDRNRMLADRMNGTKRTKWAERKAARHAKKIRE